MASVRNPVTRPHQSQGDVTLTVYLDDFSWEFHGMGEGTHLGRMTTYTSSDLLDAQGRMHGAATAANGDKLFWVIPGTSGWHLEFAGGTGRFQNASGGQNTVYESEHVTVYDPELNALVTTWSQKAEGQITY
ncbi:MAG: hypothetical protein M5U12_33570 [Verrucomicrobia bacterium]|nr:hypothetical protein [Verrucomicrobiota bacterium]